MKKNRYFDEEFKRNLIAQIDNGMLTKAQASREYQLAPSLIDRWQQQVHEGTLRARPSAREAQLERELERYKKKVGELSIQVDLLKKLNEVSASMRESSGSIVTGKRSAGSRQDAD
jgi:transposase